MKKKVIEIKDLKKENKNNLKTLSTILNGSRTEITTYRVKR
jgi:hypothetical protein